MLNHAQKYICCPCCPGLIVPLNHYINQALQLRALDRGQEDPAQHGHGWCIICLPPPVFCLQLKISPSKQILKNF